MLKLKRRSLLGVYLILAMTRAGLCMDAPQRHRAARNLQHLYDPFGLLNIAGEAVHGAVQGVHGVVQGLGQRMNEGAEQVGKMMEQGAANIDSAFKEHFDNMQAGMEEAGKVAKIVSEDLADSVSVLVSNNLSQDASDAADPDLKMEREGIVDGVLKMVGIDSSKVGLMALNVLIFLAEMITSSLIGEDLNSIPDDRSNDSLFQWFLPRNPFQVDAILGEVQDPGLPRTIIEKLVRETGDKTACVQLLICKMSPVIWGIQRSIKEAAQPRHVDPDAPERGVLQILYDSLPGLDDFVSFSESCEKQFPTCPLLSLTDLGL